MSKSGKKRKKRKATISESGPQEPVDVLDRKSRRASPVARWFRERLPQSKEELWRSLVGLFLALLFYVVVFAILYFCTWLLGERGLLNPWIKGEVAIDMLKTIINADSALIGFTAVIAVFGLREISRTIERAQGRPKVSDEDKDKLESWRTNFLWLLSATVFVFAMSVLLSLQSISYATTCQLVDNVIKCVIIDPLSNSYFLWPLYFMFLGLAGVIWISGWSLRGLSLKFAEVKVTIRPGFTTSAIGTSETLMFFEAANVGERPVLLISVPSLLLPDDTQLILVAAKKDFTLPHELSVGSKCELWQEASKLAEELLQGGYSGKTKLVCQFKDAIDNSYRSKPITFDIDDWLPETGEPRRGERRYMKQCVGCSNWIPLASETCGTCHAKQPGR